MKLFFLLIVLSGNLQQKTYSPLFVASAKCADFAKTDNDGNDDERLRAGISFSDEQIQWFCEQNELTINEPDSDIRLTDYQKGYLDFTQRCQGAECLDFKFAPDSEIPRGKRDTDSTNDFHWRCRHPEAHWRPKFCNEESANGWSSKTSDSANLRLKRQTLPRATRKEYRMLSDFERQKLHHAMRELKLERVDDMSKWDLFTFNHDPANAIGAHWGPAFLPWHRELLRQFEVALRNIDPDVALPYWDMTLDWGLPQTKDSVLWTEDFLGNGDGHVWNGPFANWKTLTPLGRNKSVNTLFRTYTERWYKYEPRPVCYRDPVSLKRTCGSRYLFCDEKENRCRSKIKPRGNCTGLENTEACLESSCIRGMCVPSARTMIVQQSRQEFEKQPEPPSRWRQLKRTKASTTTSKTTTTTTTITTTTSPTTKLTKTERPKIAMDELPKLTDGEYPTAFMKILLFGDGGQLIKGGSDYFVHLRGVNYKASQSFQPVNESSYPEHSGIVYVSFRRPTSKDRTVGIRITAFNRNSDPCSPFCFDPISKEFIGCDGFLRISLDPSVSDPVAYSYSSQAKRFLNVNLTGHPSSWAVSPPYLNFLCDGETDPGKILSILNRFSPNFSESEKVFVPILVVDKDSPFQLRLTEGATITVRDNNQGSFTNYVTSVNGCT